MILSLYRASTALGAPLIDVLLRRRISAGREDRERFTERKGIPSQLRPPGPLIWFHAASVGESLSVLPVIESLRRARPGLAVLVTTGTVSSATLLRRRLPTGVVHQYVPVDRIRWVRRFLEYWRPALAIWVEQDLWPNLVTATADAGVPMILLNARMSGRSLAGWQRWPGAIRNLLECFDLCLAQSTEQADRFRELGAADAVSIGNLKFAAPPLPVDPVTLAAFEAEVADRPLWLAASVHPGEESAVVSAHAAVASSYPGLLTVIVPRHPQRAETFAAAGRIAGLDVARRSAGDRITRGTDLYIGDTMGELGLFYRAAPFTFVGGSLVPHGGQNPIEPARLGRPVILGPWIENFAGVAEALRNAGAAVVLEDTDDLGTIVNSLLGDPARCSRMAAAAARVAEDEATVLQRVLAALAPYLDRAECECNDSAP